MRVCVGVTGSIAAYRSPDFVKELVRVGHEVQVVLTSAAQELVSARVLSTFSGRPVLSENIFAADHQATDHISAARWAECFVIYGATADFLARYANGFAGDFLNLQLLTAQCPVIVAPAMNPTMWSHPAVRQNKQTLAGRGVKFIDPIYGKVACGEIGLGHIADLQQIIAAVNTYASCAGGDTPFLEGKKLLISAGPMRTALDPVRYVQNRSSGLMGLEIARTARQLGADVRILLGPVDAEMAKSYNGFPIERYVGPTEYGHALEKHLPEVDAFLSVAAVLDFEFIPQERKIERDTLETQSEMKVPMKKVRDYVAFAASIKRPDQKVIAFAAESGSDPEILERAHRKMLKKGVDAMVANPVRPGLGPEAARNELWILQPGQESVHLGPDAKEALARPLLKALFQNP